MACLTPQKGKEKDDAIRVTVRYITRLCRLGWHEVALRDAGVHDFGVIWRTLDGGILLAIR